MSERKHCHYWFDLQCFADADIYRLLVLLNTTHPCAQHIFKKVVCAGNRGHKDVLQDVADIADTAKRWAEMLIEDEEQNDKE